MCVSRFAFDKRWGRRSILAVGIEITCFRLRIAIHQVDLLRPYHI